MRSDNEQAKRLLVHLVAYLNPMEEIICVHYNIDILQQQQHKVSDDSIGFEELNEWVTTPT